MIQKCLATSIYGDKDSTAKGNEIANCIHKLFSCLRMLYFSFFAVLLNMTFLHVIDFFLPNFDF